MIKAVIFDMDGVIIDSEPLFEEVVKDIFNSFGFVLTSEEHKKFCGTTMKVMWTAHKEKYKLPLSVEELSDLETNNYLNHLKSQKDIAPIEGIPELINELRQNGYKLAVASSSPMEIIDVVLNGFGLAEYFDVIVTGKNIAKSKPEPDIFLHTAEKLGIEPDKCIVIEDSHNGATAAKRAGMKCIGFNNPHSGNQDLSMADRIITVFEEIKFDMNGTIVI